MEAVSKFFGSLWEDLTKKVDLDTKRVRQATISSKAPDEELRRALWDAMGAGGVLKPYAIGRFTGIIGSKAYAPSTRRNIFHMLRELLFVPQKEFGRIKTLEQEFMPGHLGGYAFRQVDPETPRVALSRKAKLSTVWHEFTHARQYAPEGIRGGKERRLTRELFEGLRSQGELSDWAKEIGFGDFYRHYNPLEVHARTVGDIMSQLPSHTKGKYFERLYLAGLKDVIKELRIAGLNKQLARWE